MAASLWERSGREGDMDVANRTHLRAALAGVVNRGIDPADAVHAVT
jgi:hypothetical protein